ncbi:MAG: hypothetical protein IKH97_07990 [Bacteroidales bacterium]|nr:hypothetical protein [Bacteroidales bacterium]
MDNIGLFDELNVRSCGEGDLDKVLDLESIVLAKLERPDLLRRNTEEMWRTCLQSPHVCLGAWNGDVLVALAVLYVPKDGDTEALAPLLQSVDPEGHKSANFKICLVHPKWRGHHLQVKLGNLLNNEAHQRGIDLLCATASPHNIASIRSLQQLGYRADHTVQKYGFERTVFFYFN